MKRARLSNKVRAALFLSHDGRCHLCKCKIMTGERWEVSHPIPLELGGADDETNRAAAHYKCHRAHTAKIDAPAIAKSRRTRIKNIGAWRSSNPLPCGRDSKFKKKVTGEVVRR